MAKYINRYDTVAAYTAEASARDNLGRTVSLVTSDGKMHYDGKLNPLGLPPKTIRCKFASGYTPTMGTSQTSVDSTENVWDIEFRSLGSLFYANSSLLEVLGANLYGVTSTNNMFYMCQNLTQVALFDTSFITSMISMFASCSRLTSVPLFDTSSVTNMSYMFNASGLIYLPLLDTSSVTNMDGMFNFCQYVEGGALAVYQQASTQDTPPTNHENTFKNCGNKTITGAAELAQIPTSWGGTAAG